MTFRNGILFIFILCMCKGVLPAQDFEVTLRISTGWRLDQLHFDNLHMNSDYDMYEYETDLLSYLIEQNHEGKLELFSNQKLSHKVTSDSISHYFNLPPYHLLDSLVDCKEIFYAEEYANMFPEGYNKNWDDFDFGDDFTFDDSIDTSWEFNNTSLEEIKNKFPEMFEPDSMNGSEQIDLFQKHHVYLHEIWTNKEGNLSTKSNLIRIDLLSSNPLYDPYAPDGPKLQEYDTEDSEFPRMKVTSSIYLQQSDWYKIPVEIIFEKKWNSLSGATLDEIFDARNFPALLTTLKQKGAKEYIFKEKSLGGYGYKEKDSLLMISNYSSFYHTQRESYWKDKEELIFEPVRLLLSAANTESDSSSRFYTKENSRISKEFLLSSEFQDLLQKCYSRKIPSSNAGELLLDPGEELDSSVSSLQIIGLLNQKNSTISFSPKKIIITDRVGNAKGPSYPLLSINISDIQQANIMYKGESLYDFLSSLTYYYSLVSINDCYNLSNKEEEYLRKHLFSGTWDKIHQEDKDHWSCDWHRKGSFPENN